LGQVICVSFNSYKLLDGFLQDLAGIGSPFTSFFFCCPCPLMCLMCCSFYFHKLKLKANCRSSGPKEYSSFFFWFPTGYCTKCPPSYQNKRRENVHLESWVSCVHVPVKFEGRQSDRAKNEVILRSLLKVCSPCEGPYLLMILPQHTS
jgi:hypothetical protein